MISLPLLLPAILYSCFISTTAYAQQVTDSVTPEIAGQNQEAALVHAKKNMVVTAHPLATNAGFDVLKHGGSAIDAMVAVQTVLGLVEPQSSGLGGGAFLVYYDAASNTVKTFDGRETAPLNATPELFQDNQGNPLKFYDAVVGGRSVGTPGTVKLLYDAHQRFGSQPWASLLQPAISLATDGFTVTPRLAEAIAADAQRLQRYAATAHYFFDQKGSPLPAG
ncbi:MAG: gamma-glutamyltransferase, partial [Marinobacter psychrophilus]|nr:gamma-glutamyltransferase [Marinobacter psychrophilus]